MQENKLGENDIERLASIFELLARWDEDQKKKSIFNSGFSEITPIAERPLPETDKKSE